MMGEEKDPRRRVFFTVFDNDFFEVFKELVSESLPLAYFAHDIEEDFQDVEHVNGFARQYFFNTGWLI